MVLEGCESVYPPLWGGNGTSFSEYVSQWLSSQNFNGDRQKNK